MLLPDSPPLASQSTVTVFTYTLAAEPVHLVVNQPPAVPPPKLLPSTGTLQFLFENTTASEQTVDSLSLSFTVDFAQGGTWLASPENLCAGLSPQYTAPDGYTIQTAQSGGSGPQDPLIYKYSFISDDSGRQITLPPGDSVYFELYDIAIGTLIGIAEITVWETVGSNVSTPVFYVPKYPFGFGLSGLLATTDGKVVNEAPYNTAVTLNWNTPATATSAITIYQSGKPPVTPQYLNSWTSPPLTQDTIFTVVVSSNAPGGPAQTAQSLSIAVQQPDIEAGSLDIARDLTATGTVSLERAGTATLFGPTTSRQLQATGSAMQLYAFTTDGLLLAQINSGPTAAATLILQYQAADLPQATITLSAGAAGASSLITLPVSQQINGTVQAILSAPGGAASASLWFFPFGAGGFA